MDGRWKDNDPWLPYRQPGFNSSTTLGEGGADSSRPILDSTSVRSLRVSLLQSCISLPRLSRWSSNNDPPGEWRDLSDIGGLQLRVAVCRSHLSYNLCEL